MSSIAGSQRLLVVVGPSGAGKDSLLRVWLDSLPDAMRPHRARRTITRAADPHEDHEAISDNDFERERAAGAFALCWTAHGLAYGVRHRELAALKDSRWVVLNGSRAHLPALREAAPQARIVAVTASAALRQARLQLRGREDAPALGARLQRELPAIEADLQIDNGGALADAVSRLDRWWRPLAGEVPLSRPSSAAPA